MRDELINISGAFGLGTIATKALETIDLSIGEPRLSYFPQSILENLSQVNKHNYYYPSLGDPKLIKLIEEKFYTKECGQKIVITPGAIGAIDIVFRSLLNFENEILLPDPGFSPYEQLAKFTNTKVLKYSINFFDKDFTIDWASIRAQLSSKTKLLLINTPHNPTGRVFTIQDKLELISILQDYPDLLFVIDEVYRELLFTNESPIEFDDFIHRGFIIGSFSKMYPLQGARVGWLVTDEEKMKAIIPYLNNCYGAVSSYGQELAKSFLIKKINYQVVYQEALFKTKEILLKNKLNFISPEGAIFIFIYVGENEFKIVEELKEQGIIVIPGSNFGSNGVGHIRICYASPIEKVEYALNKLAEILAHNEYIQNQIRENVLC